MAVVAIHILSVVIVIVLPIEAIVTAVKLVAVEKFMASKADVAPVALTRVVVIATLATVWPL